MQPSVRNAFSARSDFRRARQQAALQQIVGRLTGRSVSLLSYEEVAHKLKAGGRLPRGIQDIPLARIVGSVGRYNDFTRDFLPRRANVEDRWIGVKAVAVNPHARSLPPIDVYQIGEAYFVLDGNHRVSVAHEMGLSHISAQVTEVRTRVPFSPGMEPDHLIIQAEYAEFLEYSGLDRLRLLADLSVSVPGQYAHLENHIEVHRYFMELERGDDVALGEAVASWYDEVYLPVVQGIREQGILRDFPNRTETDLYLWLTHHRLELQKELGWDVGLEAAAADLAARFEPRQSAVAALGRRILRATLPSPAAAPGQWREQRLADRYSDRLFHDLLVPISGADHGWAALEQALLMARREQARVHGLHVTASGRRGPAEATDSLREQFNRRCQEAGVAGNLAVESGRVAGKIVERALLADLVVVGRPPAASRARMPGWSSVIRQCARPILVVPQRATSLEPALLAYDGSPKAREALFLAAYLAEQWQTPLVVLAVVDGRRVTADVVEHARAYLEMHEVEATYLVRESAAPDQAILEAAAELGSQLIIVGSSGVNALVKAVLGSSVERIMQEADRPVLIAR